MQVVHYTSVVNMEASEPSWCMLSYIFQSNPLQISLNSYDKIASPSNGISLLSTWDCYLGQKVEISNNKEVKKAGTA